VEKIGAGKGRGGDEAKEEDSPRITLMTRIRRKRRI
jgi:hypothetical protein